MKTNALCAVDNEINAWKTNRENTPSGDLGYYGNGMMAETSVEYALSTLLHGRP